MPDDIPEKRPFKKPLKVLNEEQIHQLFGLASVLSKEQIASYFGMCDNTFRAIEKRQPEVAEAFDKGKAQAIAQVGAGLLERALAGDNQCTIFFLKTRGGYKETTVNENQNVEMTHEQWLDSLK